MKNLNIQQPLPLNKGVPKFDTTNPKQTTMLIFSSSSHVTTTPCHKIRKDTYPTPPCDLKVD
jgi:hypothetical protein